MIMSMSMSVYLQGKEVGGYGDQVTDIFGLPILFSFLFD